MDKSQSKYISLAVSLLPGLFGSLLGGAISWGVATQKLNDFERRISKNEASIAEITKQQTLDRVYIAGELGQIKAKLDSLLK